MKAVAIMTPEPKYFATKNAIGGTCIFFVLAAAIGSSTPKNEPNPMMKMVDIRSPKSELWYPLPLSHWTTTDLGIDMMAVW
jgi:hypothetical protein